MFARVITDEQNLTHFSFLPPYKTGFTFDLHGSGNQDHQLKFSIYRGVSTLKMNSYNKLAQLVSGNLLIGPNGVIEREFISKKIVIRLKRRGCSVATFNCRNCATGLVPFFYIFHHNQIYTRTAFILLTMVCTSNSIVMLHKRKLCFCACPFRIYSKNEKIFPSINLIWMHKNWDKYWTGNLVYDFILCFILVKTKGYTWILFDEPPAGHCLLSRRFVQPVGFHRGAQRDGKEKNDNKEEFTVQGL